MSRTGKKSRAALLAGGLVLLAAAGGLTWTGVTVAGADTTAETVVVGKPPLPASDDGSYHVTGRHDTELLRQLLPVPEGYLLGPDIAEFGNDTELSGKEAEALLQQLGADLPSKVRSAYRKQIRDLEIQGLAMRSYSSIDAGLVIHVQIAQMKNEKAVRELNESQTKLTDALSVLRDGPKIKGYDDARCYLLPEVDDAKVDAMHCTAAKGGLLVSMDATGVKPLRKDDAADLLKDQLDRLVSGGGTYV